MNNKRLKKLWNLFFIVFLALGTLKGVAQEVAIKTNLLYGGLMQTPNIGVEIGVSPKLTLNLWGAYNPFPISRNGYGSNNRKMKHWLVQPEARYWFCERFNGHFVGIHAFYGQYNIGGVHNLGLAGLRRQGNGGGGGLSYGYQWILSSRWGIEGSVGIGYARLHYDIYPCEECGKQIGMKSRNYLGPTNVAISVIYLLK